MALLALSGLVMAAGVALGVTGALRDEQAVRTIQAQQAAAVGAPDGSADSGQGPQAPASGFVGQGGEVTWPIPVPGLPGGSPTDPGPGPDAQPCGGGDRADAGGQAAQPQVADPWSPAIFRMGFGFFAGFSMAYALRAFARVTLVSAGMFFLLLFGLQYAGLIEVRWSAMADRYDTLQAWLRAQMGGVQAFLTGYLPSAGAALAGLALGFVRR